MNPTQTIPAVVPEAQSPGGSPKERLGASKPAVPLYAVLAVLAFCTLWTLLGSILVQGARLHDFLNLYAGASLARDGGFAGMHVPEVQLQREQEFAPQLRELVPFVRPPFYALLLAPLAWLPFGPAFWAWLGLQAGVLAATWTWAFRRWGTDALIFGSMYLPTALGIAHGQDCVLVLWIVLGTYALARREKHFFSGAILGLGLIKFHLFLLWPLALLVQQRWRMLAGACVAVAAELLASLVLAGPSGHDEIRRAPADDRTCATLSPSPELMINARALAINFGIDHIAVTGLLTAAAVILTIAACWRAPLWRCSRRRQRGIAAGGAARVRVRRRTIAGRPVARHVRERHALSPHRGYRSAHADSVSAEPGGIALGRRHAAGAARVSRQPGLHESVVILRAGATL